MKEGPPLSRGSQNSWTPHQEFLLPQLYVSIHVIFRFFDDFTLAFERIILNEYLNIQIFDSNIRIIQKVLKSHHSETPSFGRRTRVPTFNGNVEEGLGGLKESFTMNE